MNGMTEKTLEILASTFYNAGYRKGSTDAVKGFFIGIGVALLPFGCLMVKKVHDMHMEETDE